METCVACSTKTWNMFLINTTDGASTVIQRRVDGSVEFDHTWNKYEQGFGDLESKYFIMCQNLIYG